MPSQLPTTDLMSRKVKDLGIGTYDSPIQSEYNEEGDFEFQGESIPVVRDPRSLKGDDLIGSPDVPVSDVGRVGASDLPGDLDRPPLQRKKPEDSTVMAPIESVAQSGLPSDKDNPPARLDYYDRTKVGDTMLPGSINNDHSLDRFLESLGNWWSGWTETDVAQPTSFPKVERPPEESDKYTSVPIGASMRTPGKSTMNRQATNFDLVGTLTSDFLKKHGRKGLTRRHVVAFLQIGGYHQYLASDIIRCLQHRYNVHVADVLDQFPMSDSKMASANFKTAAIRHLIGIRGEIASIVASDQKASKTLKACGDSIMQTVAELVRDLENG